MDDEEPIFIETGGHEWGPLPKPDEDGVTRVAARCCGQKAEMRHGEWRLID